MVFLSQKYEGHLKLIKSDSERIYSVTKDFYIKCSDSEKKPITISTKNIKQITAFSTFSIVRNIFWAPNHNIWMISEGSCDTEDWTNGC